MENLTGRTVQGYDLLERVSSGRFGAIYRAFQPTVGREVAIKVIFPAHANRSEFIRRFKLEAQLVARLDHLHVVPLYDFWREPDGAYIVMRWLRGGSLKTALRNGGFDLQPAVQLMDQLAGGLAAAHYRQIVHRNLKPSNILLDEESNAYLADFAIGYDKSYTNGTGIERDGRDASGQNGIADTIRYLSPEQLRGEKATPQSDIYSLGITLYEMLSGEYPFPTSNSMQQLHKQIEEPLPRINGLDSAVANSIGEVINRATAKTPKERYADVLTMASALREAARIGETGQTADLVESLTRREQEILQLIVEARSNKEIARELFLELSTVKWHINNIYKKLGVRSRVQAIVRSRDFELIAPAGNEGLDADQKNGAGLTLPDPVNPYKGLRPFEATDSRDFFGREALVEKLLARLAKDGSSQFLAIVGPSGSGKSSLIKAGLIPAVRSGQFAGSDKWFIVEMQPGRRPLDNLRVALTRIAANRASNLLGYLNRDVDGLTHAAKLVLPNDQSELLLVIDQMEELFTLVEDEVTCTHFMDLIHSAASDPQSRVRVVIALRADYYDRPLQYPAFGELVRNHQETLLPLAAEELERAIINPAQQSGVTFESGLVATIIEDVNYRPGTLPLLQFALAELFEQRNGRMMTRDAYEGIGGSAGALTRRAEELYQEQEFEGREMIRQMFLRLVSVSGRGDAPPVLNRPVTADTRGRVLRSELLAATINAELLEEIIDTFAAYRLLSLDFHPATRQATVEVAHEAILREWDRLRSWMEESLVDLGLHRQLVRATNEWLEGGRESSFLLRGARLVNFENWAKDTQLVLTPQEKDFLNASIALREERTAAERARKEHQARLERRSSRRLRALVGVMAVALVVSVTLTIAAIYFARQADEQRSLATTRELAAAAAANLDLDPERSVLLALEAARTASALDGPVLPEVESVLRQAIQADRVMLSIPTTGMPSYSPDGMMVAIGGEQGRLSLWDAATGEQIRELLGHEALVIEPIFSPDGRLLFTAGFDSRIKVWQLPEGRQVGEMVTGGAVGLFALNSEASQLAAALRDGDIEIWDISSFTHMDSSETEPLIVEEPILVIDTPLASRGLAYSPDGQRLAILVPGLSVFVRDANSGLQLLEIEGTADSVGVAFSPDGDVIAASSDSTNVTLWNSWTGEEQLRLHELAPTSDIQFDHSGHNLVTATVDGTVTLWDVNTGSQLIRVPGRLDGTNTISLHPDGQQLATGSDIGSTRIWDLTTSGNSETMVIAAHVGDVYDAVYSPDGTRIASTGEDGMVKVWKAENGELLLSLPGLTHDVFFPAFDPLGERLAAPNREGGVSIWDARSGQELLALSGGDSAIITAVFSPDGSQLAAADLGGSAHIWDTTTGEKLAGFYNGAVIMRLVYELSGERIWTYDMDGFANSWAAASGELIPSNTKSATRRVCNTVLWDAEFSQDGRYWAAVDSDGLVHVFEAKDDPRNKPDFFRLYTLHDHTGSVSGMAFNPDGSLLASASYDGTVRLWDMRIGRELSRLVDSSVPVRGVDFNADGSRLVTAGSDGTISVHLVSIEELIKVAQSRLSRGLSPEECRTFLHRDSCRIESDVP